MTTTAGHQTGTERPLTGDRDLVGRWPAEPGIWVFILSDMTLFAVFFVAFLVERSQQPLVYARSSEDLHVTVAIVNTLVLLTSSLGAALAVHAHRDGRRLLARRLIDATLFASGVFLVIKLGEWGVAIADGHTPRTNGFFMYYFTMTGIHIMHVLIGICLLLVVRAKLSRPSAPLTDRLLVEAGGSYWHMVDILWLVLFPLFYLVPAA